MVALVLLPGMDGTGELFAPFVAALGSDHSVTVVRYPTGQALGYAELEAVARAALPTDRPFVVLGESFSGPIAVSLAASKPPHLVGLVLCASFVRNPRPLFLPFRAFANVAPVKTAPGALLEWLLLSRFATPELRLSFRKALAQVSLPALQARLRSVLSVDVSAKLASLLVPTLYLRATQDRVVPASASRLVSQLQPTARVVEIEAPHFLLQAAPSAAALAVKTFMQGLRGAL